MIERRKTTERKPLFRPEMPLIQKGDQREWERWVTALTPSLISYASTRVGRTDAEDLVQTTWAKVYKNRGTITDDNPSSYLFTSLQNGITNHWENCAVSRTSPVAELGVLDGTMEDSYATIDTRQSLLPAINNLTPEHQRQIGYLLGDVPTRDVQEKENLPKGTVLTRRYRALAALRKELGEI